MAADSAVMVIDGSKGVEKQTIKLFKVCVMRNIPIITFINKMDRDAKNSFDLLEDIENVLGIHTYPVNWPIGSGKEFKGVYDRNSKKILAFTPNNGQKEVEKKELTLDDPALEDTIGYYHKQDLFDEIELLDGAGDEFDLEAVRNGQLTPVFFGSALQTLVLNHSLNSSYSSQLHLCQEKQLMKRLSLCQTFSLHLFSKFRQT